jgi:predicted ATPase
MPEFVRRIRVKNYKSIGHCDVELGRFTILVGRNGSGKSNFLDALRFIKDSLESSLDHALKARGGILAVRRIGKGHPRNFTIEVEFETGPRKSADWRSCRYGFEVASRKKGGYTVRGEWFESTRPSGQRDARFEVADGEVRECTTETRPPAAADRLYLVNAAGLPEFRPAYDALLSMGFYNLNPEQMREIQSPDAGELLRRDGRNIASVIARLTDDRPEMKDRIREYLRAIVPDITDFGRQPLGHKETLQFRQVLKGDDNPWGFQAASMSDGTLRTLGILVAVMQLAGRSDPVKLVGIEEPETALHPAATNSLVDSLREGTEHTQLVVTTHSPDLLDAYDPDTDTLLVVQAERGETRIGPADAASTRAVRDHLFSAGDLLRMDQLQPALELEPHPQPAFEEQS